MKKEGPRGIPDFSSKRKSAPVVPDATELKAQPAPQVQARNVKPAATSAKSGRRGQ